MNSNCNKIRPLLSEYVDGALDPRRTAELNLHLADCPDCRRMAEDFRANKSVMASLPLRQTSTGFDAALAARLAAVNQGRSRQSWLAGLAESLRPSRANVWRPAFASMAAVGVVACSLMFTIGQPHQPLAAPANNALIQQCVNQHRSYAESQPLSDFSAQTLAGQLDSSPADVVDDDTL